MQGSTAFLHLDGLDSNLWLPMRLLIATLAFLSLSSSAHSQERTVIGANSEHVGFDRNDYPGDDALPTLRKHFSFVGYWLTNPPGETTNPWIGKREILLK